MNHCVVFFSSPEGMTDREDAADVDLGSQRKIITKQLKSLGRLLKDVYAMKERETAASVSMTMLRERSGELSLISKRANRAMELIYDHEDDEDKSAEDERVRSEYNHQAQEINDILHNLGACRRAALMAQSIEKGLAGVEDLVEADATKDCSACFPNIQKQLNDLSEILVNSTIPPAE